MTSEEQMAQFLAGKEKPMAGAGTNKPIDDINRLVIEYGGNPADWSKVKSANSSVHKVTTPGGIGNPKGHNFEIHAYENKVTGQIVEPKTSWSGK